MSTYPSKYGPIPTPDLENWNLDREVTPPTMVRGGMHKTSAGSWDYDDGRSYIFNTSGTEVFTKFADGKPRIGNTPYGYDVAEGSITGHSAWFKIGFTPLAVADTESDLWSYGGKYTFPTSAIQMSVRSVGDFDISTGGGAVSATVYYLTSAHNEATVTATLSAQNWVDLNVDIYRVNGFRVTTAGVSATAVSALYLADTASKGNVYSYISPKYTRARNGCYTVPAGKTVYVTEVNMGYGFKSNSTHYARIYTRATLNEGVVTPGIFYPYSETIVANMSEQLHYSCPTRLPEKTDLKTSIMATFNGNGNVAYRGWIETN